MGSVIGGGLEAFLHRQAREQAMNILAEAQEMAERIEKEGKAQAARETKEAAEKVTESLAGKSQRAVTQAHHQARLTLARRQGEVADQVWGLAKERLGALSSDARRQSLRALMEDAVRQLETSAVTMACAEKDRVLVTRLILEEGDRLGVQMQLAEESATIMGGVLVRCATSNRLVDNSWDERLRQIQRTRRDQVFAELS